MPKKFTAKATGALESAASLASKLGHTYIGSEHLLLSLSSEPDSVSAKLLERKGANFERIRTALCARIGTGEPTSLSAADMTPRTKRIIESSSDEAENTSQTYIGTEHLLLALIHESSSTAMLILESLDVNTNDLEADILSFRDEITRTTDTSSRKEASLSGCPTLQKYGRDLTAMARSGKLDPVIGRDDETERVIKILSRRTKNNPCLIGEPGVGKTAVVEGLASRIAERNVPEPLMGKLIVTLDLSAMVAGAKYRGEFEERMKAVLDELSKNPSVIVFIDEIHTLTGTGAAEGAVDAANIMKPALARGEIKLIGATTIEEYRKHIEKDAALERRFGTVNIKEPTEDQAIAILTGLRDKYESHHKVKITDDAIKAAVIMSSRYIGDRFLPDKALDLIDEAAANAVLKSFAEPEELKLSGDKLAVVRADKEEAIRAQEFEKAASLRDRESELKTECERLRKEWKNARESIVPSVGEADIAEAVSVATGIPRKDPELDERERLSGLAEKLKSRIVGQDAAADALASAICRGRMGLSEPDRPVGSFIFLGPTGVGKTELCKVLAEALFGDKNDMIRIDMSELAEKHSVSKLIGSPPGYIGYGEGGILTEKVRRKPYCVVLFDEIEKAHPDVTGILLQILEDGQLTDSEGRRVNFKNTVVIMTSNIGAAQLTDHRVPLGFYSDSSNSQRNEVMEALKESFRPEFINRIDEIIIFSPLKKEDLVKICRLMLNEMASRLSANGIGISFDDKAAEFIADKGYDEKYGARPLRRAIRTLLEDPLSKAMLDGKIIRGDRINVYCSDNKLIFQTE